MFENNIVHLHPDIKKIGFQTRSSILETSKFGRWPNPFALVESQIDKIMKKGIHPEDYRLVVFKDMSNDHAFLSRSTAPSDETIEWEDGSEYPLIKLEISYTSHPFFTGVMQFVDTAGRVDKFKRRYAKFDKKEKE